MREPEVLHREQIARVGTGDPGPVATPRASLREPFELLMQPLESMIGQAVNPVVEDALHVRTKPTVWRRRSRRISGAPHCVLLPWRRLNIDRESICACGQQELSATGGLEQCTLLVTQVKSALKLRRLAWPLRTEEQDRRIGGHD